MKPCRRTFPAIAAGVPMAGADIPGEAMRGSRAEPEERPEAEPNPTLCPTGDGMSGRGIDRILPHPGDPRIFAPWVRSALDSVHVAERKNGPIPRSVDFAYVRGDARERPAREVADLRIVDPGTAVTADGVPVPEDIAWPQRPLDRESRRFATRVIPGAEEDLLVEGRSFTRGSPVHTPLPTTYGTFVASQQHIGTGCFAVFDNLIERCSASSLHLLGRTHGFLSLHSEPPAQR